MKVQLKQIVALGLMLAGLVLMLSLMPEHEISANTQNTNQAVNNPRG